MESFGGSLGYLGSKTSLTIVLRVTVAARIDLRGEGMLSLRMCYSYCPGLIPTPPGVAIQPTRSFIEESAWTFGTLSFYKIIDYKLMLS